MSEILDFTEGVLSILEDDARDYAEFALVQLKGRTPVAEGNMIASYRLLREDDAIFIVSTDPGFPAINKGLHLSRRGLRGSRKAPRGMSRPAAVAADRFISGR